MSPPGCASDSDIHQGNSRTCKMPQRAPVRTAETHRRMVLQRDCPPSGPLSTLTCRRRNGAGRHIAITPRFALSTHTTQTLHNSSSRMNCHQAMVSGANHGEGPQYPSLDVLLKALWALGVISVGAATTTSTAKVARTIPSASQHKPLNTILPTKAATIQLYRAACGQRRKGGRIRKVTNRRWQRVEDC